MPGLNSKSARRFVLRLERLTDELSMSWLSERGPDGLMQYQLDIGALQRDIQGKIRELKSTRRSARSEQAQIAELAWLLKQARSLGDSLAWTFLARSPRKIIPLTENRRVPVPSKDTDGSRGVFEIAKRLMLEGWGIPIVHDITDCLRIGDVTFVGIEQGPRGRELSQRTVEVKTHRVSATPNGDGSQTVEYLVTVIGPDGGPESASDATTRVTSVNPDNSRPRPAPVDRRLSKQLKRMEIALMRQKAEHGSITIVDGQPHLTVEATQTRSTDWMAVRRAIREAHSTGIGVIPGSPFVSWVMVYNASGVSDIDVQAPGLASAALGLLQKSGGDRERNSLTVMSVPPDQDEIDVPRSLPLLLWEVPKRAKYEVLRQKLMILALVNTGGLELELEARGFSIQHDDTKDLRAFKIVSEVDFDDGSHGRIIYPFPWRDVQDVVHDFTGLEGILPRIEAFRDTTNIPVADLFREEAERL